jgi:PmbA protein
MTNSVDRFAEQLLDLALQSGAEAAEVYQSQSWAKPVFFEANRLKQLESTQAEGTALRLWIDGRPGLAVAYGAVDPQTLVDKAKALSALNEAEPIELTGGGYCIFPQLGQGVEVETLLEWGKESIALVRQRFPEVLCSAEWQCETETSRLINSLGLDYRCTDTTLSCYMAAEWVRGDDFLSVADGETRRDRLNPLALAEQIIQRLTWAQNNSDSPTGRVPVLFTAKAADMLWGPLQAAMNGKQVLENSSPWSDRLGEVITHPQITIRQRPEEGPFSCPFDDEGTVTQPLDLIEQGVLKTFYSDRTTARRLGIANTGNGVRPGLGSYPSPSLFNFVVVPGQQDLMALVQQMDQGIIVDQILGGGPGISGDFSVNIDLGYRVQNGEVLGRVKDTMVAGNVYAALKQLLALGSDGDWNGACFTPSVVVDGLSVNG